jgi:HlyD family secretion protein
MGPLGTAALTYRHASITTGLMKKLFNYTLLAAILLALGFGAWSLPGLIGNPSGDSQTAAVHTVQRRTIEDRVVERGTIESQNTVYGKCELPGWQNKIISILPEGTFVKKGEVVAKLEAEEVDREIAQTEVQLNEAKGKLDQSNQELEIQLNKGESDIAAAQLELTLAKLDLEKYRDGDFKAEQADQRRAIQEAQAQLEKIRDERNNIEVLVKKGYKSPQQLREFQLREKSFLFQVERDERKLEVLESFDYRRKITEFEAKAIEAQRKFERAKTTARAEQLKAEAAVENAKNAVALHERQLKEKVAIKEKCTLKATQDGTVAYANERWYDPSERIREGTTVRSQQDIYYLPDMTKMQVKASVHESVVDRISVGQQASIRLDAFSDVKLKGTVSYVSELAASSFSDAKNYDATILIEKLPDGMAIKPGMTAEVDILIGTYSNVIAIPIGAITEHFQRTWVYVMQGDKGERRAVTTGRMTHSFVEITDGLQAGEVVALDAYQRGLADFAESEREGPGGEAEAEADSSSSDAITDNTASAGAT